MNENTIVLWDQDGVETIFEKIFSVEIDGESYVMLSPVQSKFYSEEGDDEEILVFKIKEDSEHGELLVHLKEEEYVALVDKCRSLLKKFVNSNEV